MLHSKRSQQPSAKPYQWSRSRIEEQQTQPLPKGNLAFHAFLRAHRLSLLDVSLASGVRYLMLWNIEQNNPVCHAHALRVRSALYSMTGFLYQGPIAVHGERQEKHVTTQRPARR